MHIKCCQVSFHIFSSQMCQLEEEHVICFTYLSVRPKVWDNSATFTYYAKSPNDFVSIEKLFTQYTNTFIFPQVAVPPDQEFVPLKHSTSEEPAKTYPFILDPFQKEALLCLENNQSVLVSAHTSAGKTVVAV